MAYLDPGNIAGNLDAGIKGGYSLIWTLLWATLIGLFYQVLAAKLGVVTQRNLAKLCAQQYDTKRRYTLWLMTELAIIGSDIQEVIGSAIAFKILFGIPLYYGVVITVIDCFLFLYIHYWGMRKLEAFFIFLIIVMAVSFSVNMTSTDPDVTEILYGAVVPTIP